MRDNHACFWVFWYNLDMEWQGNPPLSLTKTKWVIICDFISYFMCNVGQHISKTSMATPQLFYIDEIHVLQRILLQFFKQIVLLLYFRCEPPYANLVIIYDKIGVLIHWLACYVGHLAIMYEISVHWFTVWHTMKAILMAQYKTAVLHC